MGQSLVLARSLPTVLLQAGLGRNVDLAPVARGSCATINVRSTTQINILQHTLAMTPSTRAEHTMCTMLHAQSTQALNKNTTLSTTIDVVVDVQLLGVDLDVQLLGTPDVDLP